MHMVTTSTDPNGAQNRLPSDFAGRVAVVIGGASGMGRATAELFAARGAKVSVSDVDAERGAAVAEALRRGGAEALFTSADIRSPDDLEELVRRTVDAFGGIDAVFLSAGRAEAELAPMLELYLQGPANVVAAMLPHLQRSNAASITFTGSTSGLRAHPGAPWYATAKAGLVGMTRTLAVDLARKGIRVNAVCPSGVDTPMLRATMPGTEDEKAAQLAEQAPRKPLGRWVTAADVANAAVFLASPAAGMITGVSLPVDGGETL
jgi:NAD(P)-dependent dehydrogenase (short-subunit alcohol dehydrogenase family)